MLAVLFLLENRGLTVLQKVFVSVILLEFKLLKYCCFAFFRTFVHLFPCFLWFWKFTQVRDLSNLLRNFEPYHDLFFLVFLS